MLAARWLIVAAILVVIFQSVDWHRLVSVLDQANIWLILVGILSNPLVMIIAAVRWHTMLRAYHNEQVHYSASLKDYWSGVAIGYFSPASLGWDVYRVTVATRRYGNVIANSATIVVEKIMALLTCTSLVILLVPFMNIAADNRDLQQIIQTTYFILVGTLGILAIVYFMAIHSTVIRFFQNISYRYIQRLNRLSRRNGLSASQKNSRTMTLAPLRRLDVLFSITILSFFIQLTTAVGNQVFFISMNYDLPFLVNLFVTPILYFVFLLPISFGSLGIREGGYILFYGAFGVPLETALLASFFSLLGVLLSNLLSALILALNPGLSPPAKPTR